MNKKKKCIFIREEKKTENHRLCLVSSALDLFPLVNHRLNWLKFIFQTGITNREREREKNIAAIITIISVHYSSSVVVGEWRKHILILLSSKPIIGKTMRTLSWP